MAEETKKLDLSTEITPESFNRFCHAVGRGMTCQCASPQLAFTDHWGDNGQPALMTIGSDGGIANFKVPVLSSVCLNCGKLELFVKGAVVQWLANNPSDQTS